MFTNQVIDYLQHALLGSLYTVFGSLQGDLVALRASAREAHHHTAILLSYVPQDLAAPGHKVAVVLGVNIHNILHNIILRDKIIFNDHEIHQLNLKSKGWIQINVNIANYLVIGIFKTWVVSVSRVSIRINGCSHP